MPIDLYYAPVSTPCRAVLLASKLLGLDLNLKKIDLLKNEQLAPEFVKINPQHTIPTIVDNGFVLWESYAIMTYLVQQYGKDDSLYPKDLKKRAVVDQRLYFDLGTLSPRFFNYYFPIFFENAAPDPDKREKVDEAFQFLDTFLEGHRYVAGDHLTVADVSLVATVSDIDASDFDLTSYKNITRWFAQVQSVIPDYQIITGKEVVAKMFAEYAKK